MTLGAETRAAWNKHSLSFDEAARAWVRTAFLGAAFTEGEKGGTAPVLEPDSHQGSAPIHPMGGQCFCSSTVEIPELRVIFLPSSFLALLEWNKFSPSGAHRTASRVLNQSVKYERGAL